MAENIKILKGYSNGTLELSDNGHTKAKKGKGIKWKIKDQSDANSIKVVSIESIYLKSTSGNIFSVRPYRDGDKWKAEIDESASTNAESEYAIRWQDPEGNVRTHDPKISVLPSDSFFNIPNTIIVLLISLVSGLFLLKFFHKRRK